jgi:Helix-turn-helix domain
MPLLMLRLIIHIYLTFVKVDLEEISLMAKNSKPEGKADEMEDLITQAQAAELRGVSRPAIAELVRRGRLRTHVIAGKVFVFRSEVESFQREHKGWPKGVSRKPPARRPSKRAAKV